MAYMDEETYIYIYVHFFKQMFIKFFTIFWKSDRVDKALVIMENSPFL